VEYRSLDLRLNNLFSVLIQID